MNTTQNITLEINKITSFVHLYAKQGDVKTRYVRATLTQDGVQYKPPIGALAYFRCEKPDGTGCFYSATINTDGTVTAELTQQALASPGRVTADICVTGESGETLSTASFVIRVEKAPLGVQIESSNEYLTLIQVTQKAEQLIEQLEQASFRESDGYIQATVDGKNWVDLVEVAVLVGPQGPEGKAGEDGADGKSAYQYAKDGGYTGTEEEFAEKLAQETTGGATPAFYVTVQMNSDGTAYEADKTVDDIGAAYQAGRPIFCNLYGETGYRMTLLLTTWTEPPTYMYSFSGADSVRAATVNITQTGVGVIVNDIPTKTSQLENDSWFITDEDIPEVPTELPNPNALTFTGAVSGSYDGSSAQTINIPTIAGEPGADGKDGADGYTPVKGTDYWTDADQESIVQQVIAALGTPVFGRVDAEKNIVLSGSLAEGNYTVKYEDATGNQTVIGSIAVGGGIINMIPVSKDADGSVYNDIGYKGSTRLSSSGVATTLDGHSLTGFIPITFNDVMYGTSGMFGEDYYDEIAVYTADKTFIKKVQTRTSNRPATVAVNDDGTWSFTPSLDASFSNIAYVRVCAVNIDENSIITINQPLS